MKPRVRLPHITGMPRCHTACLDTEATWRQEHLVFSPHYFPVKASRLPNPQPSYLTAGGKVKGASKASASLLLLYP